MDRLKAAGAALFHAQTRLSYRRLLVLAVGTGLLFSEHIESGDWLYLAIAYIGSDAAEKALGALRRG